MHDVTAGSIRRARVADAAAVLDCDSVASEGRSDAIEVWLRDGEVLVEESDEVVAGFVVLEYRFFGQGFIPLLCVRSERRRRGVAMRLLAAAERSCRTSKLFTSTNASNIPAQRLFERAGFVRSGTIENLDVDDPELVYYKRLAVG